MKGAAKEPFSGLFWNPPVIVFHTNAALADEVFGTELSQPTESLYEATNPTNEHQAKGALIVGVGAGSMFGIGKLKASSKQAGGRKIGEPPKSARTRPLDLQEELALREARSGRGKVIVDADKVGDPRYAGTHDKMTYVHNHPDGTKAVIRYWRDTTTGELWGFKFKDDPGSRGVVRHGREPVVD